MMPNVVVDPVSTGRDRLVGLAYRLTGSRHDAEEVVHDAWLRWSATDAALIERPDAWATTVVTRLALDRLRAQKVRRDRHVGPWLPEFEPHELIDWNRLRTAPTSHADERLLRLDSVRVEVLVLLDQLSPIERAVVVLADALELTFGEIAEIVDRSPASCRQLASRARKRMRAEHAPVALEPPDAEHWRIAGELLTALAAGDVTAVLGALAPDVQVTSDGGATVRAARRVIVTPHRVSRFLMTLSRRVDAVTFETCSWNGSPGLNVLQRSGVRVLMCFECHEGLIRRIWIQMDPAKTANTS